MEVSLIALHKDGGQREIPLRHSREVVGRQRDCSLRIPVASVSRNHCEIVQEDGALRIRDLGSSNGTYVNQKRVQETELAPGDLVAVGPVVMLVRVGGEPGAIDVSAAYERGMPVLAAATGSAAAANVTPSRPASPDTVTQLGLGEADDDLLAGLDVGGRDDADGSSEFDFSFDLEDDEDDQPAL